MSTEIKKNLYTNLGKSGLKISKIVLGCMSLGSKEWASWVVSEEEKVFEILKAAYDSGVRTWDTADMYSVGESERWIGKFIKAYNIPREDLVILSKCYNMVDPEGTSYGMHDAPAVNRKGLNRKHIFDAVEASCERLGTYIDVLQIHRYDYTTPDEEVMRALNDVVNSGKVRYIGASSMWAYQFNGLQSVAEKHGWHKFISMQNLYNLLYREEEREMIPYCNLTGVGLLPWSPIAGGILARPKSESSSTARGKSSVSRNKFYTEGANAACIDKVERIAKKHNVSMATVSLAWCIAKGTNPIVGVGKVERLYEALEALDFELSKDDLMYLEEGYSPVPTHGFT